jgi:hypothetical protein
LPTWFVLGRTWVLLAHEQVMQEVCPACEGHRLIVPAGVDTKPLLMGHLMETCEECEGAGIVMRPGVFRAFVPRRVVRMIPDTMPEEDRQHLRDLSLTLVVVPHDDPDHQPTRRRNGDDE